VLLDSIAGHERFDLLRQLKEAPRLNHPVIVLTHGTASGTNCGFELGANDYVTKPFEAAELRARVCAALRPNGCRMN